MRGTGQGLKLTAYKVRRQYVECMAHTKPFLPPGVSVGAFALTAMCANLVVHKSLPTLYTLA